MAGVPPRQSLPRAGLVSQLRQNWAVYEDEALATRIQHEEINHHYQGNKNRNQLIRSDLPQAKEIQSHEIEIAHQKINKYREELSRQAEADSRLALQLAMAHNSGFVQVEDDEEYTRRRDAVFAKNLQGLEQKYRSRSRQSENSVSSLPYNEADYKLQVAKPAVVKDEPVYANNAEEMFMSQMQGTLTSDRRAGSRGSRDVQGTSNHNLKPKYQANNELGQIGQRSNYEDQDKYSHTTRSSYQDQREERVPYHKAEYEFASRSRQGPEGTSHTAPHSTHHGRFGSEVHNVHLNPGTSSHEDHAGNTNPSRSNSESQTGKTNPCRSTYETQSFTTNTGRLGYEDQYIKSSSGWSSYGAQSGNTSSSRSNYEGLGTVALPPIYSNPRGGNDDLNTSSDCVPSSITSERSDSSLTSYSELGAYGGACALERIVPDDVLGLRSALSPDEIQAAEVAELLLEQERADALLAQRLQDEMELQGDDVERERKLALEAQDREYARVLQAKEKARARRAKEKARQKKLEKQRLEEMAVNLESLETLQDTVEGRVSRGDITEGRVSRGETAEGRLQSRLSPRDGQGLPKEDVKISPRDLHSEVRLSPRSPEPNPPSRKPYVHPDAIDYHVNDTYCKTQLTPSVSSSSDGSAAAEPQYANLDERGQPLRTEPILHLPQKNNCDRISPRQSAMNDDMPIPPYMPMQSSASKKSESLERKIKKKKEKEGCKQQ